MKFSSESDFAKFIVKYLEEDGWQVYKEVVVPRAILDIVAIRHNISWHIETKMTYSCDVLTQAYKTKTLCHYNSIAIPKNINCIVRDSFCVKYNIGKLVFKNNEIVEEIRADLNRYRKYDIFKYLHEDQKKSMAGSQSGNAVTPFKRTMNEICNILKYNGPLTMKDIMKRIGKAHYSSFSSCRASLQSAIDKWYRDIILIDIKDGKVFYSLKENI